MTDATVPLRMAFDEEADAAYIDLADRDAEGWLGVVRTVSVDTDEIGGTVNLDVDADGRILGPEVLSARSLL